jgi:hypothetical protein
MSLRTYLKSKGIRKNRLKAWIYRRFIANWFLIFYSTPPKKQAMIQSGDPVRYGTVGLALKQILKDNIAGALVECGVYAGAMSK